MSKDKKKKEKKKVMKKKEKKKRKGNSHLKCVHLLGRGGIIIISMNVKAYKSHQQKIATNVNL